MYYKCELLVGGYAYGVTDLIKNWDDMVVSFKRNDYDGVIRTFTDKFEFVGGARSLLLSEYRSNYLHSNASIVVSTRNNSWTWTERFRCSLNFSTLSDDGFVLAMNAVDDSVAALIKAKQGTEYEYSVDVVKDAMPLMYDRMEMHNSVQWIDGGSVSEDNSTSFIEFPSNFSAVDAQAHSFPIYITSSEIGNKNKVEVYDISLEHYSNGMEVPPFLTAVEDLSVHLKFGFKVYGTGALGANQYSSDTNIRFIKKKADGSYETLGNWSVYAKDYQIKTEVSFDDNIALAKGDSLALLIGTFAVYAGDKLCIYDSIGFKADFVTRGETCMLDVISPDALLNRLLRSMNGGQEGLTGVIVPSGEKRLDNAMILAAESVRKMPGAKVYSSFSKFCQWMRAVFGYVYDINGKVITFRPRADYFGGHLVKEIKDYNGYRMSVNSSIIYSQVNVGYEKQDYDSVNGKDEFRFMNIYNTGVTMTDGKLELISPYRADAYGIEFLAQRIGEDTTDNESDNGVFFVCVQPSGGQYVLDRSDAISGVISPTTMFNVMYSPTSMIEANKDYLGGFIPGLDYASSEGNTAVVINGKQENRDIVLNGGMFGVNEVEIETSDVELPQDMTGIVQFEHQGEMVQGYYKNADFHYTKTRSAKITLIMKING